MKIFRCDKCKKDIKENNTCGISCFEGSIWLSNIDLCDNCWKKLEKIINNFGEEL